MLTSRCSAVIVKGRQDVGDRPRAVRQLWPPIFRIAVARARAEALDEREGTGGGLIALDACLVTEKRGNRAMDDLRYRRE